jgi:DNA-binding SARP family transcriptional activator
MLRIRLFGSGEALYHDRRLLGLPGTRAGDLLCYLLLNGPRPHGRDRLAAVFWGEYPTQVARKHLRNILWHLRQLLQSAGAPPDQFLYTSDEYISFVYTSPYWLDTEAFEIAALVCQACPGAELCAEQADSLELAADLYRGDLLESSYEDWCLYDRERLRSLYQNVLDKLLVYHALQGNYKRSLTCGSRLLTLDPTQEKNHRQMMCLHWLSADRSAALAQYKRCCQVLRAELDIEPLDVTRQLYEALSSGQVKSPGWLIDRYLLSSEPGPVPAPTLPPTTQTLLDKLHELQRRLDETNSELHQLEQLIQKSLPYFQNR